MSVGGVVEMGDDGIEGGCGEAGFVDFLDAEIDLGEFELGEFLAEMIR